MKAHRQTVISEVKINRNSIRDMKPPECMKSSFLVLSGTSLNHLTISYCFNIPCESFFLIRFFSTKQRREN